MSGEEPPEATRDTKEKKEKKERKKEKKEHKKKKKRDSEANGGSAKKEKRKKKREEAAEHVSEGSFVVFEDRDNEQPSVLQQIPTSDQIDEPQPTTVVTIRCIENLVPDPFVVSPVVRFWLVDGLTGLEICSLSPNDPPPEEPSACRGYYTYPYNLRESKDLTPRWETSIDLKYNLREVLSVYPDAMLLFDIIDCSKTSVQRQPFHRRNYGVTYGRSFHPICWAFLKLQGVSGIGRVSGKHRLQLYRAPQRRSLFRKCLLTLWPTMAYPNSAVAVSSKAAPELRPDTHPLYLTYLFTQNRLDKYPSSLNIAISEDTNIDPYSNAFSPPVSDALRTLLSDCRKALQISSGHGKQSASDVLLLDDGDERDHHAELTDEPIEFTDCSRLRNEQCQIPVNLQASLSGGKKGCLAMAFSPDGSYLAVAACEDCDRVVIRVHDAKYCGTENSPSARLTCPEVAQFTGHTDTVYTLLWSPDGNYILTCAADCTAKLWPFSRCCDFNWGNYDTLEILSKAIRTKSMSKTAQAEYTFIHPCYVYTAVYHPLGEVVITGGFDDTIRCWSTVTGKLTKSIPKAVPRSWISHLAMTNDGSMLFSADGGGELKMWTVSGMSRTEKIPKIDNWAALSDFKGKGITHLSANTSAKHLYVWTRVDSCITCINTSTYSRNSQVRQFRGPRFDDCSIKGCLSPCGSVLSSGSGSGTIYFWETQTGEFFADHDSGGLDFEHSGPTYCTAWSPTDHRMAFATYGCTHNLITVWYRQRQEENIQIVLAQREHNVPPTLTTRPAVTPIVRKDNILLPPSKITLGAHTHNFDNSTKAKLLIADDEDPPKKVKEDPNIAQIIAKWTQKHTTHSQRLLVPGTSIEVSDGSEVRHGNVTGWTNEGLCCVEYSDFRGGIATVNPIHVKRLRTDIAEDTWANTMGQSTLGGGRFSLHHKESISFTEAIDWVGANPIQTPGAIQPEGIFTRTPRKSSSAWGDSLPSADSTPTKKQKKELKVKKEKSSKKDKKSKSQKSDKKEKKPKKSKKESKVQVEEDTTIEATDA